MIDLRSPRDDTRNRSEIEVSEFRIGTRVILRDVTSIIDHRYIPKYFSFRSLDMQSGGSREGLALGRISYFRDYTALGNVNQRAGPSVGWSGFPGKMAGLCGLRRTIEKRAHGQELIQ